jgi:large subunit ribosomal protein L4e
MKISIYEKDKKKSEVNLPSQFDEEKRADLIKRAVLAEQSNERTPYGTDPEAGMKHSAKLSRRRRKYRGSYGFGISRVPRKILSRRGTRFNWAGAVAPGTVGGRKAHPPKAEKKWEQKINKKEKNFALRVGLSYSIDKTAVSERGHLIPTNYPLALSDSFEKIDKTKDAKTILEKLGFDKELERSSIKKIRSGKGKGRARPYKKKKGLLIVVSSDCKLLKSARNIPGIDIVKVEELTTSLLAPGTVPGRATLFTESAIKKIDKDRLFI